MSGPAGAVSAAEVLGLAGTAGARAASEAFCRRGAAALRELFAAILDPDQGAAAPRDAHPADIDADRTDLVVRLATAHPETFLREVTRAPALLEHSAVLAAAGQVRSEETDRWVLEALSDSSQFRRGQALQILLDRSDPAVVPRLAKLLRDRGSAVRFLAADGLRRFGTARDLAALARYAERAPPGGVERARDAAESICAREGAALPPWHPGPRLVEIDLAGAAEIEEVLETERVVREGELLARADGEELRAPRDGFVVARDRDARGRLATIVLRAEPR